MAPFGRKHGNNTKITEIRLKPRGSALRPSTDTPNSLVIFGMFRTRMYALRRLTDTFLDFRDRPGTPKQPAYAACFSCFCHFCQFCQKALVAPEDFFRFALSGPRVTQKLSAMLGGAGARGAPPETEPVTQTRAFYPSESLHPWCDGSGPRKRGPRLTVISGYFSEFPGIIRAR